MGYLPATIVAALAMSISVYDVSGSILLAFLSYSLTGTLVLLSVLLSDALAHRGETQFSTTE